MMNSSEDSYCRLCAQLKQKHNLLDLKYDKNKMLEVVEKLMRVNSETNFFEDLLPKTVCFECLSSLDQAFQFVLCVESSQDLLSEIFLKQIKKETDYSIDDEDEVHQDFIDPCEDLKTEKTQIKEEFFEVKLETDIPKGKCKPKASKKKHSFSNESSDSTLHKEKRKAKVPGRQINIGDDDDALPLSQLKLSWKDYDWTCSHCETQFTTIDELRTHSMQFHNTCNAYRCTDCNIRKVKLDSFLVHVRRHRKNLKLSCYKCFKTFSTPYKVKMHANEHKSGENVCHGCNATFTSVEELNDHTRSFYNLIKFKGSNLAKKAPNLVKELLMLPTNPDDLTCILCNKTFKRRTSLNTHLLIHTERPRDHTCDKCGKRFLSKQTLAGHLLLHDSKRPHQCEICKATFKTPNHLKNHVGVHDTKKPFACEQCGRCFRLHKQLKSHKIIHTDELPHVCSFCNKSFRFKTILNQHIRQHTGIKPYSCQMCQRDFTNWPNYNKHMKRRHGMDMSKRKHTPDGFYPVDQNTGEVIVTATTEKMLEWKKQMMRNRKPGRPKFNSDDSKTFDDDTTS